MDYIDIGIKAIVVLFCLLTLVILVFVIPNAINYQSQSKQACINIGFKDYVGQNSQQYCSDQDDNLHYVKMDCNMWGRHCTAKEISVGGVGVVK